MKSDIMKTDQRSIKRNLDYKLIEEYRYVRHRHTKFRLSCIYNTKSVPCHISSRVFFTFYPQQRFKYHDTGTISILFSRSE